MIAGASITMGLGVIAGGLIGGFYGLNSYYLGQYDTSLENYKNGILSFNEYSSQRTELGNSANAFGYLFYAMIPTSCVFVLISAILYSAAPYETRFERKLQIYEKMLNVSIGADDNELYFSYGIKL